MKIGTCRFDKVNCVFFGPTLKVLKKIKKKKKKKEIPLGQTIKPLDHKI